MKNTDRITTKAITKFVITVGAENCQFTSIQAAIDHATTAETNMGKEIYVQPGTYIGNLIIPKDESDELEDIITIYSDCIDDCIIVGSGTDPAIQVFADDFCLSEVTVTGGAGASGIVINGTRDCKFERVRCTGNLNGMEFVNSDDCKITDCEFIGNTGYGLKLTSSDDNIIRISNAIANGNGFGFFGTTGNRVHDCAFISNFGYGLKVFETQITIINNTAQYNVGIGMSFEKADGSVISTGFLKLNGSGIELIDTDDMLIYSTPILFSGVKDLTIDAASQNNAIAHNFYHNNGITNLSNSTWFSNNHIDLSEGSTWHDTLLDDSDVATVGYVKYATGCSLTGTTTNNSWTTLLNANAKSFSVKDGETVEFVIRILGSADQDVGVASSWEIKGIVQNAQDTVTLLSSSPSGDVSPNTLDCYPGGSCPWRVKIEANNTNSALKVSVKGELDETIKWSASLVPETIVNAFGGHY